ncbi:MAG: hypothetical protein H6918_05350 [Sphingomonadaceae bacterium]|nr:hypothetical protein [Sphingomonadaceae bacterium]
MKLATYFISKSLVSFFGLLFQLCIIWLMGVHYGGIVNTYQIYGLAISFIIFPGIELTFLRALPAMKVGREADYKLLTSRIQLAGAACFTGSVILSAMAIVLLAGILQDIVLVTVTAILFALMRVFPVMLRIDGRQASSVVLEQGNLFLVALLMLPIALVWELDPTTYWGVTLLVTSVNFTIIVFLGIDKMVQLGEIRPQINWSPIRSDYGVSIILTSISNFGILWLPMTVSTFFLSATDIALTVTSLRLIGILLFVEGIAAAYYLPRISAEVNSDLPAQSVQRFRVLSFIGTAGAGLAIYVLFAVGVVPVDKETNAYLVFFAVIQLTICLTGSPYSLASVLCSLKSVRRMTLIMLSLIILTLVLLALFPDPRTVIASFIGLQTIKAFLGYVALIQERIPVRSLK